MADNKMYTSQIQDNGNVMISEEVISGIVEQVLKDVDGIAGLNAIPVADIAEKIGMKSLAKGVKVNILEAEMISVDCNVQVAYGQSVVDVAKAAQVAVTNALESMTGVKVSAVNVNVCGIVRK